MNSVLLISDAAKKVNVEAHVLRYWEEELGLPIKRNELGHRYYTEEDVKRFREIKDLKERGLQLKAIRMVLKNGKLNILSGADLKAQEITGTDVEAQKITGTDVKAKEAAGADLSVQEMAGVDLGVQKMAGVDLNIQKMAGTDLREQETGETDWQVPGTEGQILRDETHAEKMQRLKWLLQQLFKDTLQENNEYLCRELKDGIIKEMDYQFRMQEEREEERNTEKIKREEEHYKKIDDLLRRKRKLPGR